MNSRQTDLRTYFSPLSIQCTSPAFFFFSWFLQVRELSAESGCTSQALRSPQQVLHPPILSKSSVLVDAPFWHRKVLQESSVQVRVNLVSSVEFTAFVFPLLLWLCRRNHWGNKSMGCPSSAEAVLRKIMQLSAKPHPWMGEGEILGAQTGCTLHTKGNVEPDLCWEQNQGPAKINPGLHYLSCTSLCFLVSPGRLTALQKCVKKDGIIPYLSKPETGNTRKDCLVQFPVQLCSLKKCR